MKDLMEMRRAGRIAGAICLSVTMVVLLLALGNAATARQGEVGKTESVPVQSQKAEGSAAQDAFVFRFDPVLESFETFTIPTGGANPHSVAVVSNAHYLDVWFTEPGADQIGRLVYTATHDYAFNEYTVTTGSEPLNLTRDGDFVWFTARKGNYIGRLEIASSQIVTFGGLTSASRPSGIDVAPDGSVWFTEMAADKIASLVVTDTSDYEVQEYPLESGAAPLPIETYGNDYVWFGETVGGVPTGTARLRRLWRADGSVNLWATLEVSSSYPYDLEIVGTDFWLTERGSGQLSQVVWTTNIYVNSYDIPHPRATPTGLTIVGSNEFWFTLETPGILARVTYTDAQDFRFDFFSLPIPGLWAQDVAADEHGNLWVVAFQSHNIYLPLVSVDDGLPTPLFGVQTYAPVSYTHGLSEMADMGVHWVRVQANWKEVEPANVTPDQYNWTKWDARVNGAAAEGMELLMTLAGNPTWAARYAMGPVTDTADLIEFLGAAVERYDGDGIDDAPGSPVVTYWEIYNEPDNADPWYAERGGYGYFGHNGDGYAALLEAIYPVVKAASHQTQVVFGGVAHDSFEKDGGPFDEDFVTDVLINCTAPCFDVMNYHYFPGNRSRWEPYGKDIIGKNNYFASILADYGFDRPMMCSETSWGAAGTGNTPDLQARYVPIVHVRGMAANLLVVHWYALLDNDPHLPGLLDNDYQPKPAYYAYRTLTTQLGRSRFVRPLTEQETGSGDVEGYVFEVRVAGGFERRDIVWYDCPSYLTYPPQDCPDSSQVMTIAATAVKVTDLYGNESVRQDSDDGITNGNVTLIVTASPVYLDYTP